MPTAATFVTAFPHGQSRPVASNLNLGVNETRANLVTVAVGADRTVDLYNNAGSTHLIADLAGYYSTGAGSKFLPMRPSRLLYTHVGPGSTTVLDLTSSVPASATAVVLNITGASATSDTFVAAWPSGSSRPNTSTVNIPQGGINPNLTTVAVGPGRKVNLYNNAGELDLIADLSGFYTQEFGAVFTPVSPVRVLDTRNGTGTYEAGPIPAGTSRGIQPGDAVPDKAIGAVFNLTGIDATAGTHLAAWQDDYVYGPSTSNLNLTAGQTAANLAVVALQYENPNQRFSIYNNAGNTHVAADLAGYFWVPPVPCTSGCAYVWGSNFGYLGNGTTTSRSLPVPLGLSDVVGVSERLAVRSDGTVWAWGSNYGRNLGTDWSTGVVPFPARVADLTGAVAVANTNGGGFGPADYALRDDGTVWSWGTGAYGSLGGASDPAGKPIRVTGLTGVTAIAAGEATGYALRNDGTVLAWGWNDQGQLGSNSTADESTVPVRVAGLTGVTAIAAGSRTAYAVTADGSLWTWGSNAMGKLGTGSTAAFSRVPVRVSGLTGVADVDGDYYNSYAVRQDGTVWAWGANMSGALGNGVDCYDCTSNVPVQVVDLTGAVDVAGHGDGAHVLDTTGRVWAWGNNQDGDLGTHAPSYSTRPILIPGLQGVTKLGDGGRALAPTT